MAEIYRSGSSTEQIPVSCKDIPPDIRKAVKFSNINRFALNMLFKFNI